MISLTLTFAITGIVSLTGLTVILLLSRAEG